MLDKLLQSRSASRRPFLPEPPLAPAPAIAPATQQDWRGPQRQWRRTLLRSLALLVMLPTAPGNLSFARAYAMRSWQQEVMRMEDPLRLHLGIALSLRDTRQEFDSSQQAEARYSLLGEEAPSVLVLNGEIASLERQVAEERAKLGKDEDTTARGRQTLGGSVLSALERTRVEADRRRRYLAALVGQTLPEEALYPRRIAGSISEFAVALVLWAPGILIVYAIRDYAL